MSNFKLGFVIFPDLTQLDLTGPLQVLARLPKSTTFIVGKSISPVPSDCGLSLVPTHTFANCPALDLICIPGGVKGVTLLKGRRATTHWAYTELLPLVGATYEKARIVQDGNLFTAGGVTAGVDFGLSIAAEIAGDTVACTIQLGIEYDPAPPFDSGHPDRAPAAIKSALVDRYQKARSALRDSITQAVMA